MIADPMQIWCQPHQMNFTRSQSKGNAATTMLPRKFPCVAAKPTSYPVQAQQEGHIGGEGCHTPGLSMDTGGGRGQDATKKGRPPSSVRISLLRVSVGFMSLHFYLRS